MVKPRSCPEKFAAARALPVATQGLWYVGAILGNCWNIYDADHSHGGHVLGTWVGVHLKKYLLSFYGPKVAAALVTSSAMNPKLLLPILLWINQIPLPEQGQANDFVH